MNIKEGYIKKNIMTKVGEALMGSREANVLNTKSRNTVTYTPQATHLIKKTYQGGVEGGIVRVDRVSYKDFNDGLRTNRQLMVKSFPVDCYKVREEQDFYTYYMQFGTPLSKVFQRRVFKVGDREQREAIYQPAKRESVTVEFDVTKDETQLLGVRMYINENPQQRCLALEERAMRIYNQIGVRNSEWMETICYWMKTIDYNEPVLLAHVTSQQSLEHYMGEGI